MHSSLTIPCLHTRGFYVSFRPGQTCVTKTSCRSTVCVSQTLLRKRSHGLVGIVMIGPRPYMVSSLHPGSTRDEFEPFRSHRGRKAEIYSSTSRKTVKRTKTIWWAAQLTERKPGLIYDDLVARFRRWTKLSPLERCCAWRR